jgi:phytanoyl-CoA hydroxylase
MNPTTSPSTDLELHPWNAGFEWQAPTGPFQVLTPAQAEQFDRDGFVVLPDLFGPDVLGPVRDEIDGFESQVEQALRGVEGERVSIAEAGAITFATHLVTRSEVVRDFALHPAFQGLCADLIGPDANLYWDQAVYKKPEKPRRFPWHQDNGYAFVQPQQYLTCWVALSDATLDNGCPQVARGRHRFGTLRHRFVDPLGWECFTDPDDVAVAEVPAGGVVVFSSLTPHLTGPNTTDGVRKAYILQYAPAGAEVLGGDPDAADEPTRTPADDAVRQFPVLRGGEPVEAR